MKDVYPYAFLLHSQNLTVIKCRLWPRYLSSDNYYLHTIQSLIKCYQMKPTGFLTAAGIAVSCITYCLAGDGKVIDLGKPVGESLRPDGFYWAFDEGIQGESQPSTVDDLSGNGFDGTLQTYGKDPKPTYAAGRFGTAIHFEGHGTAIWSERRGVTLDAPKLGFKDMAFTGGVWFKMEDLKLRSHVLLQKDDYGKGWRLILYKMDNPVSANQDEGNSVDGTQWSLSFQPGRAVSGSDQSKPKNPMTLPTGIFADRQWHHLGFSVAPGPEPMESTVTYWLDGELFETIVSKSQWEEPDPEWRFLKAGKIAAGLLDDAFVTSGIHTFKK